MQKTFFTVVLFLLSFYTYAQTTNNDVPQINQFLADFLTPVPKPVLVAESLDAATLAWLKDALSIDTLYRRSSHDNWKTVAIDTFVLYAAEQHYKDSCLNNMTDFKWTNALLPGAVILDKYAVDTLKQKGYSAFDYLRTTFATDRFYFFSKPIFLRDNTICLFYNETLNMGPVGSSAKINIYIRRNNRWESIWAIRKQ